MLIYISIKCIMNIFKRLLLEMLLLLRGEESEQDQRGRYERKSDFEQWSCSDKITNK
jgi:hypothetical protein